MARKSAAKPRKAKKVRKPAKRKAPKQAKAAKKRAARKPRQVHLEEAVHKAKLAAGDVALPQMPPRVSLSAQIVAEKERAKVIHADSRDAQRASAGFMGKQWDTGEVAFDPAFWAEVLRVLKPGAHLVAFGGTRTYHRLVCAIEDAGFEVRDQLAWLFGSESHDVSKAIDRAAGAEREIIGRKIGARPKRDMRGGKYIGGNSGDIDCSATTAPATPEAAQWQGWGTALKPAWETVCVAVKPSPASTEHARVLTTLERLEARLWCLSFANAAEAASTSSQRECSADAFATAQWNADDATNIRDALCERMGTSPFASALASSLNIVSSWKSTWAGASIRASTSTIETASSTTTDWRTLRFCLSQITPQSIILGRSPQGGWSENAHPAALYFDAFASRLSATQTLSALAPAMSQAAISSRAGVASGPELEPIVLARKPLIGTVAANVLAHGCGALNIDASRIEAGESTVRPNGPIGYHGGGGGGEGGSSVGRWPANVITDGSEEVLRHFPETQSGTGAVKRATGEGYQANAFGKESRAPGTPNVEYGDSGNAARFFYTAKADAGDRLGSKHPTVKPVDLMAYLVRLVTPPGGTVLDPFAGSGTTGMACLREGFRCVLIEREAEYVADIRRRLAHVRGEDAPLFAGPSL